jgi:hypothetical protein
LSVPARHLKLPRQEISAECQHRRLRHHRRHWGRTYGHRVQSADRGGHRRHVYGTSGRTYGRRRRAGGAVSECKWCHPGIGWSTAWFGGIPRFGWDDHCFAISAHCAPAPDYKPLQRHSVPAEKFKKSLRAPPRDGGLAALATAAATGPTTMVCRRLGAHGAEVGNAPQNGAKCTREDRLGRLGFRESETMRLWVLLLGLFLFSGGACRSRPRRQAAAACDRL